jgi:hypothetical protein
MIRYANIIDEFKAEALFPEQKCNKNKIEIVCNKRKCSIPVVSENSRQMG